MKVILCDIEPKIVAAWVMRFKKSPDVTCINSQIFDPDLLSSQPIDAIVSPANSFGFMDGGIDLIYSYFFGWDLQRRLQEKIRVDWHGELPVGCADIVETKHHQIPYLISTPTMRIPMNVQATSNVYLAFRAALITAAKYKFNTILCPGLGTGVGKVTAESCADQMLQAFNNWKLPKFPTTLEDATTYHSHLVH